MKSPLDRRRIFRRTCRRGMTILELVVVIVIIAIIASMLLPAYSAMLARADEARCLANLRSLFVAGSGYLNSAGHWPQVSMDLLPAQQQQFAKLWVQALEPYGAPHSSWICPTMQRTLGMSLEAVELDANYRIDYMAAAFDDSPSTPRLTGTRPWFAEKAALHSRGQLMILSDGTTVSLLDMVSNIIGQK